MVKQNVFNWQIGGSEDWENDSVYLDATDNTYSVFEAEDIRIEEGDKLKLRRDEMWDVNWGYDDIDLDASVKSVFTTDVDGNIVFEKGGEFTFSFDVSTGKITITGTPNADPLAIAAHTLRNFTQDENTALTGKNENSEYYVENLELSKGDVFKIKMSEDDSDWRGFDDIKTVGSGSAHENFSKANDSGDIKCDVAGRYNIYVAVNKDADGDNPGKSLWISEYHAPADLVEFSVTGVDAGWTSSSDYYVWAWGGDAGTGYKYDATLEDSTIKAMLPENIDGFLVLKVKKDKVWENSEWDTNLEAQSRNVTVEDSVLSYSFTVEVASKTYTFTTGKDWLDDSDAVIVAWVWGGSYGSGQWVECNVDASGVITVELKADAENITFIRRSETMENGWTKDTNYWNRLRDGSHQALTNGTFSYDISTINWD